jgi:enoyl-CoA hydratase/carnithine racemase
MHPKQHLSISRPRPQAWVVIFDNPPINLLDDRTIEELTALIADMEQAADLKVVVFESADPDFFIAHYDVARATSGAPDRSGEWRNFVLRLSSAPTVSIAKVRGRTRGVGNEFILACDLRFASRQKAMFGQPEVGVGLIPGGGGLEWLPRIVGRSRALEIVLGAEDLDAETAERYGLINRALDDAKLDAYVDAFVARIASFDKAALRAAKELINRIGIPALTEFEQSSRVFDKTLAWPGARARRSKVVPLGEGQRSDFEMNLGQALACIGE